MLKTIVGVDKILRNEFDLDDIVLKILKVKPYIKVKAILAEANKIWDGITYTSIKRSIQRLERQHIVEMEGTNKNADGYRLVGTVDDFNYKWFNLNRCQKEVYKLLYNNPKQSYGDITEARNIIKSRAYDIVNELCRKGIFENDSHFDLNYISKGEKFSIYKDALEEQEIPKDDILAMIKGNPYYSRTQIVIHFKVRPGSMRRILRKYSIVGSNILDENGTRWKY